jgi:hypothetical protein
MLSKSPDPALLNGLRDYVALVLQVGLEIDKQIVEGSVPSFLMDRYWLVSARLLHRACLLLIPRPGIEETPAVIAKHCNQLRKFAPDRIVIFVTTSLSAHNRHRLIGQHVSFIIPGNQLFVPDLALDLREHFRVKPEIPSESLSPIAQLLVLASLLGQGLEDETATSLAHRFHYSSMSMGRAFDELSGLGLVELAPVGKYRVIAGTVDRRDLWRNTRAMLRTPVRKKRQVRRPPTHFKAVLAGESALAALTHLASPRTETRAIAASDWKTLAKQFELDQLPAWDEPTIELETWSYDPEILASGGLVDPISLWLSLPDSPDERFTAAKEALLEQVGL